MMMANYSAGSVCYIGVTGTNGKTSCAWWLSQLLRDFGKKTGLIGTLGCGVWEKGKAVAMQETGYTTPDAKLLQKILAEFVQQGVTHVVMEVSSHGLVQGRVKDVTFSSALFTNLSHDHLDYHGSMEEYGAAKARLFKFPGLRHAAINLDDDFGRTLIAQTTSAQVLTYSISNTAANVYMENLQLDANGLRGALTTPWGKAELIAPVVGRFNVSNLLGVISVLCAEGFALRSVVDAVKTLQAPPGRLQQISLDAGNDIEVFVDFAHTPDALEKVLATLKTQTRHQLWCIFGCGGDRDASKRPLMGRVVSRLADHCIVTSDNPRSENPQAIIDQVTVDMDSSKTREIEDRSLAIAYAVSHARSGDVILVAGKGHESYQEVKGIKLPFSDAEEAHSALLARARARSYA